MDTPDPGETGSWLQRRGTDLAVWVLVILAIIGAAVRSTAQFTIRYRLAPEPRP